MPRTVSAKLALDVVEYVKNARSAKSETGDLKDEVKGLGLSSDRTKPSLIGLGRSAADSGRAARAAGRDVNEMRQDLERLDRQMLVTTVGISSLAKSFARTGDTGTLKAIQQQQSMLKQLGDVRRLLPKPDERASENYGRSLWSGISSGVQGAASSSLGMTAATAIGVVMAPTIGAAIGAGIAGGIGGAGIIGGIALVAKDPQVSAYGKDIGHRFMAGITAEASVFKQPVMDAFGAIEAEAGRTVPKIGRIFANTAPSVGVLTRHIVRAADALTDSLVVASGRSGPALGALGHMIESVTAAVGDLITEVTRHSDAGASALNDLTMAMTNTVRATGAIIGGLADVKSALDSTDDWIDRQRYKLEDHSFALDMTADGYKKGSQAAELYRKGLIGAAGSVNDYNAYLAGGTAKQNAFNAAMLSGKVTAEDVAKAQIGATTAQQSLQGSLDALGGKTAAATMRAEALRTAMTNLYGAAIKGVEANESYEASWDNLSTVVTANGRSLDIHTASGRSNRDALEDLISATNEAYLSDIASGTAVAAATAKHDGRIAAVKEEARRVGLNRTATDELINTYGKIPGKKTTELLLDGVKGVANALDRLYKLQRALALGQNIDMVEGTATWADINKRDRKATGGLIHGPGTATSDSVPLWGSRGEFMQQASAVDFYGVAAMEDINAKRIPREALHGYASGGLIAPVDESRRWPFTTTAASTKIPSRAAVAAAVMPSVGAWPSSPSAQRGDSGVWRSIVAMIRATGPMSGSFGNGYRAGDPLWHGSGRAVDWMGFNQDRLASFLAAHHPLELIHRTAQRDYAYTRGVNKGSFNNSLMNAHRNHVHIAMAGGGVIREPVFGIGASGTTYAFGEGGRPETVIPGIVGSHAGGSTVTKTVTFAPVIHINGSNLTPQQIAVMVNREIGTQIDYYARGV